MPKAIIKKIKLDLSKINSRSSKKEAVEEVAEYLHDTILNYLHEAKSPVYGNEFVGLSKGYKKIKSKVSGSAKANMELYGDMLDELEARVNGYEISVGFHSDTSELTRNKADNHNKWTSKSFKTKVPMRRFIPKDEENFSKEIMRDIKEIIASHEGE